MRAMAYCNGILMYECEAATGSARGARRVPARFYGLDIIMVKKNGVFAGHTVRRGGRVYVRTDYRIE